MDFVVRSKELKASVRCPFPPLNPPKIDTEVHRHDNAVPQRGKSVSWRESWEEEARGLMEWKDYPTRLSGGWLVAFASQEHIAQWEV